MLGKCAVCVSDNETGHHNHRRQVDELADAVTIINGNGACERHLDVAFELERRHRSGMEHKRKVEHHQYEQGNYNYRW